VENSIRFFDAKKAEKWDFLLCVFLPFFPYGRNNGIFACFMGRMPMDFPKRFATINLEKSAVAGILQGFGSNLQNNGLNLVQSQQKCYNIRCDFGNMHETVLGKSKLRR